MKKGQPPHVTTRPALSNHGERQISPGKLLIHVNESVIKELAPQIVKAPQSCEGWLRLKQHHKLKGKNLYSIGFWNLIYTVFGPEAYNFLIDAVGYFSIFGNWNAGDALEWVAADFPAAVSYKRLVEGYEELPLRLAREFSAAGGAFSREHELWVIDSNFEYQGGGISPLVFRCGQNDLKTPIRAMNWSVMFTFSFPKKGITNDDASRVYRFGQTGDGTASSRNPAASGCDCD